MRSHLIWVAFFLAVRLLAATENIEETISPFQLNGNDHLLLLNRKDNYDLSLPPTNQILHEMKWLAQYDNLSLALDWTNRTGIASGNVPMRPFVLEKATLQATLGNWEIKLGDTHQEIGRGIALSLYRSDVFGIDNTVQGGELHYHSSRGEATVFGGRLHAIQNALALNPWANPVLSRTVWLSGASGTLNLDTESKVSAHYLLAMNQPFELGTVDAVWHTVGATIRKDGLVEGLDFYGEGNLLLGSSLNFGTSTTLPTGFGNYGALTYTANPWKLKWEVKDYRNDNFEFRRPPTLEEEIIETLNIVNVTGSRWTVQRQIKPISTTFFTSFLWADDRQLFGTVHHAIGGAKLQGKGQNQIELRGGYRWVPGIQNVAHALLKAKFKTGRGEFFEIEGLKQYSNLTLNLFPAKQDRNILHLTYTFSETTNTTLGIEYVPTNDLTIGQMFVNASGTYKQGAFLAKGMVGQTNGGPQCSGGICRIIPPFTGAMVETQYSF